MPGSFDRKKSIGAGRDTRAWPMGDQKPQRAVPRCKSPIEAELGQGDGRKRLSMPCYVVPVRRRPGGREPRGAQPMPFIRLYSSGDGQSQQPGAIMVDESNEWVYVADTATHRVQRFDTQGRFLGEWATGAVDGS